MGTEDKEIDIEAAIDLIYDNLELIDDLELNDLSIAIDQELMDRDYRDAEE